jgi:hypothetical protein
VLQQASWQAEQMGGLEERFSGPVRNFNGFQTFDSFNDYGRPARSKNVSVTPRALDASAELVCNLHTRLIVEHGWCYVSVANGVSVDSRSSSLIR